MQERGKNEEADSTFVLYFLVLEDLHYKLTLSQTHSYNIKYNV